MPLITRKGSYNLHQGNPRTVFEAFCTLTATGTPSSTPTASPRLPMSLQPPSPSRLTPLELVGALVTSAAVACARPPSALCGAKFKRFLPRLIRHAAFARVVAGLHTAMVEPAGAGLFSRGPPGSSQPLETLSCVFLLGAVTLAFLRAALACSRLLWRTLLTLSWALSIRSTTL